MLDTTNNDLSIINHINPANLEYMDWVAVGAAIKHCGGSCEMWDGWSRRDQRYKKGDCSSRWNGFQGSANPVTFGTLMKLAHDQGYTPVKEDICYGFEEVEINFRSEWDAPRRQAKAEELDVRVVDMSWLPNDDAEPLIAPAEWDPVADATRYMSAIFEASDFVSYCIDSRKTIKKNKDGTDEVKYVPATAGNCSRTAGELLELLGKYKDDIGGTFGDHDPAAGAWIRANPVDGKASKDANVTAYRFVLVESDEQSITWQRAIYEQLELPIAALVHSGNKSLHAIVRVDAKDDSEYRERVDFLYKVCKKNGMSLDENNKNPSRLSRLPGMVRGNDKQWLVATNIGKASWAEWSGYIKDVPTTLDTSTSATIQETPSAPDGTGNLAPIPLPRQTLRQVKTFDPELLPAAFRPWVMDISDRMQCPPDYAAVGAMVAISSVIGRQIVMRPKRYDVWQVVPNLWGGIIGPVGALKTPSLQETKKPLECLEVEARGDYMEELKVYTSNKQKADAINKAYKKHLEREASGMLTTKEKQKVLQPVDEPTPPARKRFLVSDTTMEKLGEILSVNSNGVMVFRDELLGHLRSLDKTGHETDRAFYLESWNGTGRFSFERIGRGTVELDAICVSILGGIQPGPLVDYIKQANQNGSGADGLLQRFQLLVWPDIKPNWVNVDRYPDTDAKDIADNVFFRLARIKSSESGAILEDFGIPYLRFDDEAQGIFDSWRNRLEHWLRSEQDSPAIQSHLAKYRSLIPSLALIIHLVDGCMGSVTANSLNKAIAWGEYLESHARRIYGVCAKNTSAVQTLLDHISKGNLGSPFRAREVGQKCWSGLSTSEEVQAALATLVDHRYLVACRVSSGPCGGAPTIEYSLNPLAAQIK